jgi:hypothetical protein
VSPKVSVGVIANPASGRDIRRLVAGASVFGNADKAGMVFRLLAGLGAAGVGRVLMMPASDGLSTTLRRHLHARHTTPAVDGAAQVPEVEELPIALHGTARDSAVAVELMRREGVAAIVVLGGDGTHRVVAKTCGDVPLCALSTGTKNSFPEMREATVAGLATGAIRGRARCRRRRIHRKRVSSGGRRRARRPRSWWPSAATLSGRLAVRRGTSERDAGMCLRIRSMRSCLTTRTRVVAVAASSQRMSGGPVAGSVAIRCASCRRSA